MNRNALNSRGHGECDELMLVPFGIALAIRLIPRALLSEYRETATQSDGWPVSQAAATTVIALWVVKMIYLNARSLKSCFPRHPSTPTKPLVRVSRATFHTLPLQVRISY